MTEQELLEQPEDAYMDAAQLQYFRLLLQTEMASVKSRVQAVREEVGGLEKAADDVDVAASEQHRQSLLRSLDREASNIAEIRKAIDAIDAGEYGWCGETGEKIGLPRLLSQPRSLLSFEAKQAQEHKARHRRAA